MMHNFCLSLPHSVSEEYGVEPLRSKKQHPAGLTSVKGHRAKDELHSSHDCDSEGDLHCRVSPPPSAVRDQSG